MLEGFSFSSMCSAAKMNSPTSNIQEYFKNLITVSFKVNFMLDIILADETFEMASSLHDYLGAKKEPKYLYFSDPLIIEDI